MSDQISAKKDKIEINNPGLLTNLNNKCTSTYPVFFDGLSIKIHRSVSSHFKVIHNIFLSSITPGNYRFGAVYVGTKKINKHNNSPVFFGDIGTNGNLNATMYHLFGSRFKVNFDAQMQNSSFVTSQLATHYVGNTFTASVVLSNSDILRDSGCLLLQYLQSVTPQVAIGAEYAYLRNLASFNKNNPLPDPGFAESQVSVMGRYTTPHTVWSAVVSQKNLLLNCYKKTSEQIELGLEIDSNFRTWESVGSLAFKVKVVNYGIVLRGLVDTNTNVGSVFEKRFCGSPISFSVSTNLNHRSSDFRLGLGITVES